MTAVTSLDKGLGESHWRKNEESVTVLSLPESPDFHSLKYVGI